MYTNFEWFIRTAVPAGVAVAGTPCRGVHLSGMGRAGGCKGSQGHPDPGQAQAVS